MVFLFYFGSNMKQLINMFLLFCLPFGWKVKGTVDQPVVDGSASFHRATVTSPFLRTPLTNFAGNVNVISNRLFINSMESRVGRKGKLSMKGTLPLQNSEPSASDKIELKCEVLDIRAKNVLR